MNSFSLKHLLSCMFIISANLCAMDQNNNDATTETAQQTITRIRIEQANQRKTELEKKRRAIAAEQKAEEVMFEAIRKSTPTEDRTNTTASPEQAVAIIARVIASPLFEISSALEVSSTSEHSDVDEIMLSTKKSAFTSPKNPRAIPWMKGPFVFYDNYFAAPTNEKSTSPLPAPAAPHWLVQKFISLIPFTKSND